MKIVEQSVELMEDYEGASEAILWKIEAACRNCYKSEGKNSEQDPAKRDALIRAAVKRGHTSVLEHAAFTFRVICNRGVSHEWVRHRIGWSYSQESTRYCNYSHSGGLVFIRPSWWNDEHPLKFRRQERWLRGRTADEQEYLENLEEGLKPEDAREPLPISLKTEIVCTANVVALRHFFRLRCTKQAHPQIRELALQLLAKLNAAVPILFDDLALEFFQ